MYNTIIYCEDSIEGIFTGIYEAYEKKYDHSKTYLKAGEVINYTLTLNSTYIINDIDKTNKVARTIIREFSRECYTMICKAIASHDEEKANCIYQMIVYGFKISNKSNLINCLGNPWVRRVFELSREVNYELMHLRGFLRFSELENHLLFAKFAPKNNIITFLAPHFADRLPLENFVIYDEIRKLSVIHPINKEWTVIIGEKIDEAFINNLSDSEKEYQKLFIYFCNKIAIKERINLPLQRQMAPIRFRKYMTEF